MTRFRIEQHSRTKRYRVAEKVLTRDFEGRTYELGWYGTGTGVLLEDFGTREEAERFQRDLETRESGDGVWEPIVR